MTPTSSAVRALIFVLLLAHLPSTALAQSVRLGSGTVSIGDSVQTLMKVGGKPDRVRPFAGSPSFTLYEYSPDGRQRQERQGDRNRRQHHCQQAGPGGLQRRRAQCQQHRDRRHRREAVAIGWKARPDPILRRRARDVGIRVFVQRPTGQRDRPQRCGQRHLGDTGDPEIAAQSDPHCYCDRATRKLRCWQRHARCQRGRRGPLWVGSGRVGTKSVITPHPNQTFPTYTAPRLPHTPPRSSRRPCRPRHTPRRGDGTGAAPVGLQARDAGRPRCLTWNA